MFLGANLIPERFETGEYVVGASAEIDDLEPVYMIAYAGDTIGYSFNGIYSGIEFFAFENALEFRLKLSQIIGGETGGDHIVTLFTVPKLAFNNVSIPNNVIPHDIMATPRPVTLRSTPETLDGYSPKNAKLRTYPFCYLAFNPSGTSGKVFRYEDFANGTPRFEMISEINPNPTIAVIPQDYKKSNGENLGEVVTITGYPTLSWNVDVYNVWLAQNSEKLNIQTSSAMSTLDVAMAQNDLSKTQNNLNFYSGAINLVTTGNTRSCN